MKILDNIMPISFVFISTVSFLILGIENAIAVLIGNLYILMFGLPIYLLIYIFSKFIKIDTKITISDLYKKQFNKEFKFLIKKRISDMIFILLLVLFLGIKETIEMLWTWWFFVLMAIQIWKLSYSYQIYLDSPNKK